MSIPSAWPQFLDFFRTPLVIEPPPGQLSRDAGLVPVRQFDQRIGLTRANACALDDPTARIGASTAVDFPGLARQPVGEMVDAAADRGALLQKPLRPADNPLGAARALYGTIRE